jgi:hypothetical protein
MTSLALRTARRVAARAARPFISLPSLSRVERTFEQRKVVPFSRQQARDDAVVVWWHLAADANSLGAAVRRGD